MGLPLGPINANDPAIAIIRSLPPKAPWLARLFGSRWVVIQRNVRVTKCIWRNRVYAVKWEYLGADYQLPKLSDEEEIYRLIDEATLR